MLQDELQRFDPGEPRDEGGKWTDGGGGGGGSTLGAREMGKTAADKFVAARDASSRSYFLSSKSADELKDDQLFLSGDGKSGYALDPHGDLQNLFNNGPKGGGTVALEHAIKSGATTLDAFDGFLPIKYAEHGFVPTGRMKFDDQYAPKGWDFDKYGRPDIVFMSYQGGDRATAGARTGSYPAYDRTQGKYFTDYDAAKAASRSAVLDKGLASGVSELGRRSDSHRRRGYLHPQLADLSHRSAASGARLRLKGAHDVFDEPRDEGGKWTSSGGGDGDSDGNLEQLAATIKPGHIVSGDKGDEQYRIVNGGAVTKATDPETTAYGHWFAEKAQRRIKSTGNWQKTVRDYRLGKVFKIDGFDDASLKDFETRGGHDVSDEPRDPGGKWTDAGGGGDGGDDDDKGKHTGEGYSKHAYVDSKGVIHTSNVYDAQRALFENRKVELQQVKQVSTLIKRLGETAAEMAEHGEEAPVFNLCNVSVKGTNLFCADQIGIPRVEMPVIRAGATKDFIKYLKKQGYKIEKDTEKSANLRATQNEISGTKVAAAMEKIKDRGFYKRLVVSRDDYILDGHHTWAGQLAIDTQKGKLSKNKTVKIARVDISITKLIAEAEKWTGGAGKKPASEAPKGYRFMTLKQAQRELDAATYQKFLNTAYRFFAANGHLARGFDDIVITVPREFNPDEPRDESGKWTGDGGSGGSAGEKPSGGGKKKATKDDFDKAKINIEGSKVKQDVFIDNWNATIGKDPAEFKKDFLGGLDGSMKIDGNMTGTKLDIEGQIEKPGSTADARPKVVATFTRSINLDSKSAYSSYFVVNRENRKSDIGKNFLAGNIATYKDLGIEKVSVHADIDVGGYAWAKYGYVPTQSSWDDLSSRIERQLGGSSSGRSSRGGNTMEADSWEMLSNDQQEEVFDRWRRDSYNEFLSSEIENWRESGQPLESAKINLAQQYQASHPDWASDAIDEVIKQRKEDGEPPIPYDAFDLQQAIQIEDYTSRYDDGKSDPEFSFDDDKLLQPNNRTPGQMELPGIEPADLSKNLTQEMRDQLEEAMTDAFNKQAEREAENEEPPDYLGESVDDYQREYWDSMSERDRLRRAIDYGMADIDLGDDEDEPEQLELPKTEADNLLTLARSSDPKSIWKISDSPRGKELLLNSDWNGVLNLKDKESMERFNAYVGRKKAA